MAYDKSEPEGQAGTSVPASLAELGTRLAQVVKFYQSRKSAADAAEISVDQLLAYERGKNEPKFSVLARLAAPVGVSLDWLATGRVPVHTVERLAQFEADAGGDTDAKSDKASESRIKSADQLDGRFVLVPRYDIHASAGAGAMVHSEQVVDYIAFKRDWVSRTLRVAADALALIEVVGDSMETTIGDGDLLLVNTSVPHVRDNAIYVLSIGDDLIVKRIQRHLDGSLTVKSDNKRYEPEEVPASLASTLRIVGQVVWHGRKAR